MSQLVEPLDTASTPRSRQRRGAACLECRRRKLRCDGQQPRCSLCYASDVVCQVTSSRPARGPKRGYLKALQDRIVTLEGSVRQQQADKIVHSSTDEISVETLNDQTNLLWDFPINEEETSMQDSYPGAKTSNSSVGSSLDGASVEVSISPRHGFDDPINEMALQDPVPGTKMIEVSDGLYESNITSLMQADLDQLYFDRIHNFAPIVHQRRYFSWRQQSTKTDVQICLQYTMWALAASVSAHYQNVGVSLYRYACQALENLGSKNISSVSIDIEQVQAWLLLAIHEFMCVDFRRGWISSGRAFRLIQLNWLRGPEMALEHTDWIETEQRTRTFWMAYCLDRFVSVRSGSPLTFTEQIMICLPAPEANFQNDQPTSMGFLSEAIAARDSSVTSTFIECIVVATISGRALSHRLQSSVDKIYLNDMQDFWSRHQWLDATLSQRIELVSLKYPSSLQEADPMLLFIGMMLQTSVLDLYHTMECAILPTDENRSLVIEYMGRSSIAVQEIGRLTNKLSQLSYLKLHPLTPIPLSLCADFLASYHHLDDSFTNQLQHINEVMNGLRSFNNLGRGFGDYVSLD